MEGAQHGRAGEHQGALTEWNELLPGRLLINASRPVPAIPTGSWRSISHQAGLLERPRRPWLQVSVCRLTAASEQCWPWPLKGSSSPMSCDPAAVTAGIPALRRACWRRPICPTFFGSALAIRFLAWPRRQHLKLTFAHRGPEPSLWRVGAGWRSPAQNPRVSALRCRLLPGESGWRSPTHLNDGHRGRSCSHRHNRVFLGFSNHPEASPGPHRCRSHFGVSWPFFFFFFF